MRPRMIEGVLIVWSVLAACAVIFASVWAGDVAPPTTGAPRPKAPLAASNPVWSAQAVKRILELNPFLMPMIVASVPVDTRAAHPVTTIAQSDRFASQAGRVRLAAVVGPPWRAIIVRDDGGASPLVVQVGDSVADHRVVRIVADTVVLRRAAITTRRLIGESWTR
jgi:hypothetical protein